MVNTNIPDTRLSRQRHAQKTHATVTLVIEHCLGASQPGQALRELSCLLDPALTDMTLVHAMSDILTDLPARPDNPRQLSRSIREREREQDQTRARIRNQLLQAGYRLRNEQIGTRLDDCARRILDFVDSGSQDLLVIDSGQSAGSGVVAGNGNMNNDNASHNMPHNVPVDAGRSHFSMLLATHAVCPVLLLRKPMPPRHGRLPVVFAVDGSEATMKAAAKLGALIRPEHAELTLLTVQSPMAADGAMLGPFINTEVMGQAMDAAAKHLFENITRRVQAAGFEVCRTQKLTGSPATEIGCFTELENPALVVVGSHNKKGFLSWLTGSVSGQLLHWGNHNIMVIR